MSVPSSFLASLALLSSLLGASPAQERGRSTQAAVEALLAGVERPSDVGRAIEELADLGAVALGPLFERLCADDAGEVPLGPLQTAAIHGALSRLPRDGCLDVLARETRTGDDRRRAAALEVLGRLGDHGELKLALDLGSPRSQDGPPDPALRAALERALLGLCEREESSVRALAAFFARVPPHAQASIATVVAQAGGTRAASLLAAGLGSAGAEADTILLLELAELGHKRDAGDDQLVLERVRGLLGHPDRRLRVLACLALEKLRDHEAVPDLVVLLDDEDRNLRHRAHAALVGLTGMRFSAVSEDWLAWLAAGLAWWDERAEPCRVALVSGTPAQAAASVQEIARQRLFVHHGASILAFALQRPEPDIVKSACRALGSMSERAAQQALYSVLNHPDPTVAAEARAALRRLDHGRPLALRPNPTLPHLKSRLP